MSSSSKLQKHIGVDLEELSLVLQRHPGLIEKCRAGETPSEIEIDALATTLHSFYTAIENILKRVSATIDGGPPHGELWHTMLLNSMTLATSDRPALISAELRDVLKEYLDFRHVFRHAYSFQLHWNKMAPLVLKVETTFQRLEKEVHRFLQEIE